MYDFAMLVSETHPLLSTKVKDKSQQPRKKPGKSSGGQEAKSPRTSKLSKLKDIDGEVLKAQTLQRDYQATSLRPSLIIIVTMYRTYWLHVTCFVKF
ncbi:hypothetical protein MRX96_017265 [Rhipicephalus microplus]